MENNVEKKHKSVLLQEVINAFDPKEGEVYIDATVGFGGHSREILLKIGAKGRLLGLDQDNEAILYIENTMKQKYPNITVVKTNFRNIEDVAVKHNFNQVDGIIADIGVSSYQLDEKGRGFSFRGEGPLDMRMDSESEVTAHDILMEYNEEKLATIFYEYSDERYSRKIAREIVRLRKTGEINSTKDLADIVCRVYAERGAPKSKINPSTKVFQALRIEVNRELDSLKEFLPQAIRLLKSSGKLAIITFHSKEDKIVKDYFRKESSDCICPSDFPICNCNHERTIRRINKKVIVPGDKEIGDNPRSRSAKLRIIEKI